MAKSIHQNAERNQAGSGDVPLACEHQACRHCLEPSLYARDELRDAETPSPCPGAHLKETAHEPRQRVIGESGDPLTLRFLLLTFVLLTKSQFLCTYPPGSPSVALFSI